MRGAVTRRRALAGGAAAAVVLAGRDAAHSAPSPATDADVLRFLLGVERVAAAFYARAVAEGALRGALARFALVAADHEAQHVALLEQALETGEPVPPALPAGVAALVRDPARFARAAAALEDLLAGAYAGHAASLTPAARATVARIMPVEARHAAWVRELAGLAPSGDASEAPLSVDAVRAGLRREGLMA